MVLHFNSSYFTICLYTNLIISPNIIIVAKETEKIREENEEVG